MIDLGAPPLVFPKPAIIRPAEHSLLRPGAFRSCTREERQAIIADLLKSGRITKEQVPLAMFLVLVAGWKVGNDAYTKLLLHCDGTNGSTTFTDSSASAHTVTANGAAAIATNQSKFGGASGYLTGASGTYLGIASSADFGYGTGNFTIDLWFRPNASMSSSKIIGTNTGTTPQLTISSNKFALDYNGTGEVITGTTTISTGTWYHAAVVRSSGSTKLYVNGTQEGLTYTDTMNVPTHAFNIGSGTGTNYLVTGWIDETRISKGIARWTANFTPPTQAYG